MRRLRTTNVIWPPEKEEAAIVGLPLLICNFRGTYAPTGSATLTLTGVSQL
jgi:hypothetical protein